MSAGGPPPLRPFGLVLHHDGRWTHEGFPILNRKLRAKFDRSVRYLPDEAKYVVQVGRFRGQIEVEEAAFFVRGFDFEAGTLWLSDGSVEGFDPGSLRASEIDGAWLCSVKRDLRAEGLPARLTHAAQAELLNAVSEEGGRFFVESYFGAAGVDTEYADGEFDTSETDLISGFNAGYMVEDWLAFQLGFGHISDQKINLFSIGMRSSYNLEPFNYYFSLDSELYSPDRGEDKFGIAPGAGAEMVLGDHLRVGLRYQHDFIFADETTGIDRFTARLQLSF